MRRSFTADGPNRLRPTDITEHATGEGKLYLCAVKGVYSGRIVSYSIDAPAAGCIVHSDRGSQFRSRRVAAVLTRYGPVGAMGRVGAVGDNAAMETFLPVPQKNVLDGRVWATCQVLRIAIVTWIFAGTAEAEGANPDALPSQPRR
ncbi:transposase InsO family protein [Streptomyces sp. SAI-149]|nr:transposase InsO family protein [Streptomyces sp. SAI-119]MDH6494010.1 transposase InsO family protein [Streptomyces sp. SAI-149]